MSTLIELAYGRNGLNLDLDPDRFDPLVVLPGNAPPLKDAKEIFLQKASNPLNTIQLKEFRKRKPGMSSRVTIVIADHTRPAPNRLLVPWIVEALGVEDTAVTVLVGTGTHRPSTPEELERMIGQDNLDRFKVVSHDCEDRANLVRVGRSHCGGECLLNRLYCEADIKVATGFIEPHFFAGFSGGAKALVPGIAALETILHLHRAEIIAHPRSTWGELVGNPTLELTREMVSLCPPDFVVNVTLNHGREITGIFVGDVEETHGEGCKKVWEETTVPVPRRFPVVVTTNGGCPLDLNYYQTVKGICAAERITEPGGHILVASECRRGIPNGSAFEKMLCCSSSNEELLREILRSPETRHDQWQVQSLLQVLTRCEVFLFSSLEDDKEKITRVRHIRSIEKTLREIGRELHDDPLPVAVLPMGPLTIPTVKKTEGK